MLIKSVCFEYRKKTRRYFLEVFSMEMKEILKHLTINYDYILFFRFISVDNWIKLIIFFMNWTTSISQNWWYGVFFFSTRESFT